MRITSSGNVGIGTTNPLSPLTVYNGEGVHITPTYTVNNLQYSILDFNYGGGTAAGTRSSIRLKCEAVNRDGGAGPTFYDYGAQGKLIFQGKTNNLFSGGGNDVTYTNIMTVDGATKGVGIGTTNPQAPLHVQGAQSIFGQDGGASSIVINDIPQARWRIGTGGYALSFYKHNSSSDEYSTWSEKVRIDSNGNVGIGKIPGRTLDVNGTIEGSTVFCSNFGRNGDYRFGNGWNPNNVGADRFAVGFHDNDGYVDAIMLNTYSDGSGGDANALTFKKSGFSARYYQQSFGSSNDWDGTDGSFRQFDLTNPSDDRLKENEEYITGAVDTLMKLKPQIYDLKYTLNSKTYERAAGVIVQDVWYDTPELRFLVTPGDLAEIPKEAPKRSDDPRDDPDYSKWGKEHAYLNYEFFIPYLIKGIQELVSELPRIKTQVSDIIPSTLDNYRGMLVSADTNEIKNGVPKLSLTNKSFDKRCFGVVSNSNTYSIDNEILVDTTGCGEVWVINTDNIKSGDFLTSSNVAGYAMKQNDDLLHNYTVAKSTMDCDFSPNNIIKKRVKQELTNVTYYLKEELTAINKKKYDAIEDDSFKKLGEEVYYLEYVEVNETREYDKMLYINKDHSSDMLSTDEWSLLDSNTQSEYISKYYKQRRLTTTEYSELDENSKITNLYELETKQLYYHVYYKETKNSLPDYTIEDIRQEFTNVLDEHGQIQWEDDPSGATEKAYRIRYLDADGNITDEANHVYKAALVGCTYHCG